MRPTLVCLKTKKDLYLYQVFKDFSLTSISIENPIIYVNISTVTKTIEELARLLININIYKCIRCILDDIRRFDAYNRGLGIIATMTGSEMNHIANGNMTGINLLNQLIFIF